MSMPPSQPEWHRAQVDSLRGGQDYVTSHARANPTPRPRLRTWLLGGTVAVASVFLALCFALFFGLSFGLTATLLGLVFALIPLTIVLPIFLWLDRFEAEPWRYLATALLYGALGSTFLALIANTVFGLVLTGFTDPASADTLTAVLVAPPVEESFKGAFILLMWALTRRRFNGISDGIVYAGVVAAGFAFTENIMYLASALQHGGAEAFAGTFFFRGLVSPFLHPMFTSMTGIGIGIAATARSLPTRFVAPVVGWVAAVLLHGLWNLSASTGVVGLVIGLAVGFVTFCCFVTFVIWTRSREARVIDEHLRPYVAAGWLSMAEVAMLSSMRQRREARGWARRSGGQGSVRAMRAFQDSASELALLRLRMTRGPADGESLRAERVLLDSMTARRREFVGAA